MKNTCLFILLSLLSLNALAQWNFGLEAGASNYSFLGLSKDNEERVQQGAVYSERKYQAQDPLHLALGLSVQYVANETWSLEASTWYLGKPGIKTVYKTPSGEEVKDTGATVNHFGALALQLGYRSSILTRPCVWNLGISRFVEYSTEDKVVIEVANNSFRTFDAEGGSRYNFANHLSMGLTMPFGSPDDSQYLARWQHIQSLYGPVEMFTLGLLF